MTVVYITNGATSPLSKPMGWADAGHTVNLVGCGGRGGAAVTGVNHRSGTGGGGGGHVLLTYASGALGATMAFRVPTNNTSTTDQTTNGATCWGSATFANTNYVQGGASGQAVGTSTAGGLGGNAGTVSTGSPPSPVYTASQQNSGGPGGAGVNAVGSGTGGGGAGGPSGVGGTGGSSGTTAFGGGGGGANNGGGNGTNASNANGGQGGNSGGTGGTSGTPAGAAGGASTGQGGGGGFYSTVASATTNGGAGGDEDIWTQTSNSATDGPGGGGGGGGGNTQNTAGATTSGGAGASYGAGGGGPGGSRNGTVTNTQGTGASGIIVVTYTFTSTAHDGAARFAGSGSLFKGSNSQYAVGFNVADLNWQDFTIRQVILASDLVGPASANKVQISLDLTAGTAAQTYLTQAVIGHQQDQTLNLVPEAENIGNTSYSWTNFALASATPGQTDPFGGATAARLVENTANSAHYHRISITKAASAIAYTQSVYAKPGSRTRVILNAYDSAETNGIYALYDVAGGTAQVSAAYGAGFSAVTSGITTDAFATGSGGNGWYRCWVKFTSNSDTTLWFSPALDSGSGAGALSNSYLGNGTGYIDVAGPQRVPGSTLTDYAPVQPYNFDGNQATLAWPLPEKWIGTPGADTAPEGWGAVGIDGLNPVTLVDAGTVDGLATYAAQIRETAAGGTQGIYAFYDVSLSEFFPTLVNGVNYTLSCYLRIPTAVTASDCYWNGPGPGGLTLIASAATLAGQTPDAWVKHQVQFTWNSLVDYPQIAIVNAGGATGTGFDICRVVLNPPVGTKYEYTKVAGAQTLTSNVTPFAFDKTKNLVVQFYMNGAQTDFGSRASVTNTKVWYVASNDPGTIAIPAYTSYAFQVGLSRVDTWWEAANVNLRMAGLARFAGSGSLSATYLVTSTAHAGAATFQGIGSLSAYPNLHMQALAQFAGAGSLSANVGLHGVVAAQFAGTGALSAIAILRMQAAATLQGTGALSVDSTVVSPGATAHAGEATLQGAGNFSAYANLRMQVSVQYAGAGSLSVAAATYKTAAATFAGTGSLSAFANLNMQASATLAGTGQLSAATIQRQNALATFAGTGTLYAFATVAGTPTAWTGSARLAGRGGLAEGAATNPAAWWDFVSLAVDATGHGHDGTLHGTTLAADAFGRPARLFNGTTDYIDGSTSPLEP